MTNPYFYFSPMHRKQTLTMRLSCLALSLVAFFLTSVSHAQNNVSDEWTPGQNILPTVQSDPHDQVKKLLRQEKFARAETLVDKYMAVNPRDPQMRFWKAWIHAFQNRICGSRGLTAMYLSTKVSARANFSWRNNFLTWSCGSLCTVGKIF